MATTAQKDLATLILTPTTNLNTAKGIKVAFPECTDLLLSQIFDTSGDAEIQGVFNEYFTHRKHFVLSPAEKASLTCSDPNAPRIEQESCDCCLPDNCTDLYGIRGSVQWAATSSPISRLFIADVIYI